MKKVLIVKNFLIAFLAILMAATSAFAATFTAPVVIDNTGGDCSLIGTWDSGTKTCTITQDLIFTSDKGVVLASDGITLDGNGHQINNYRVAQRKCVFIDALVDDVTVKNLEFFTCYIGVMTDEYSYNERIDIKDNTFGYNGFAIAAWKVKNSKFRRNDHYDRWDNFILEGNDNKVMCNNFDYYHGSGLGLALLDNSEGNQIKYNTFQGHYGSSIGILFWPGSKQNEVINNDFTNNYAPVYFYDSGPNTLYNNNFRQRRMLTWTTPKKRPSNWPLRKPTFKASMGIRMCKPSKADSIKTLPCWCCNKTLLKK